MRKLLLLALCAIAARAQSVGDFAPLKTGNRWVYRVEASEWYDAGPAIRRRHRMDVKILGARMVGDVSYFTARIEIGADTVILLDTPGKDSIDTVYSDYTQDVEFADGDGPLLPWKEKHPSHLSGPDHLLGPHLLPAAGLVKANVDGESLYVSAAAAHDTRMMSSAMTLQGVGPVSDYSCDCFSGYVQLTRRSTLLEFNGRKIGPDAITGSLPSRVLPGAKAERPRAGMPHDLNGRAVDSRFLTLYEFSGIVLK